MCCSIHNQNLYNKLFKKEILRNILLFSLKSITINQKQYEVKSYVQNDFQQLQNENYY